MTMKKLQFMTEVMMINLYMFDIKVMEYKKYLSAMVISDTIHYYDLGNFNGQT